MKNQFIGKQQQYQQQNLSPRSNKRSIAQEYLKQKRPVHFDISSDSDEIEQQDVQMQRRSYGLKKVDSPPLSTQSYKRRTHTNSYGNKNQEIYQLNMKLFAMQNDFLAQKQKLIQKYEKQLFDVNRQKIFLQQEKSKLLREIDLLNNLNKNYEEEIQQLKQELQMFVGQNRTTPNFNSTTAKDIGQSQLITLMTHKDQRIKDLEHKLKNLTKEKDQLQNSLTQSINKPDRSSGQSFGGNKNLYLISFGQIQENLKKTEKSLKQSNEIKETLIKQIQDFKKQLNQELDHSNLLVQQNSALEIDRQLKIKQIQALNEKISKTQNKQYLLEKQLQNLNKKLKINEDLLEIKEKQVKKFSQVNEINEQKLKRMKKEHEKNEKEWTNHILKLQNEKSLSINEKIQESKKQQAKLLTKIQSLVSENKKNLSLLEQLTVKQQKVKQQLSRIEKQRQELTKKFQQSTKQCTKVRHTCTIQEERIIQLQSNFNTLKTEKKFLKQEAQKIMRKQKNEISTLKQSLELMIEKSKKIEQKVKKQEQQIVTKEETLSGMKSQLKRLNEKLTEEVQKNHTWSQQNSRLSQTIRQYQQLIIQLKTQSYELNKQNERLKSLLEEKEKQSKEFSKRHDSKKEDGQQKDFQKAYKNLQRQYRILQTKFDKETTQKEEMVQALGQKIKYYEDRIQQDTARYQETVNEKNYYFQQAESLTYKCKQMYEYIHRMQVSENKEGNQNFDQRKIQGQVQNQPKKDNSFENRQGKQQTQQLQRQNQTLKQEVYRVTHEMQQLKSQYRTQLQKIQSYKSLAQSNKKPPKQITSSRKSSSFDSSLHEQNPLQSVIQLLKNEKQQMIHTISYQNQMIQQLQQEMANVMVMLHQKNDNSEENREKQRLDQAYQRNIEILQAKLQEINKTIREKQKIMIQMRQINEKMSEQLKEMQQNHNEQLSRLQLQLNLIKQDKKELHQELDNAHGQLIVYEKQRSKQKMIIVNEVRTQLQAKVSFIHDDVQKYKLQTKKVREEMKKLEKEHQVEIQARQQLYLKERHKLTQQIMKLNQQLSQLQERLKKANSIIAQEKLVQSQTNFKNQHFQLQYFQTKRLNQLYQHQIQTLNEEIKNLQLKNEKITKYLHQFDDKNSHIIGQMQAQIQSLMKQNDHYRQCVQQQKQCIKKLQEKNHRMSQQLRKKTLSTTNPSSFRQKLEKQVLTTSENVKSFPYSEDTFFMMENPKSSQPQQKIYSQPIKNQKQILNLYDTPLSRDRVTFIPVLRQIPRQPLYTKQHHSQLVLKPQNNYTLTVNKTYQNPQSEIKSNRKVSLPLQKQKVQFYQI